MNKRGFTLTELLAVIVLLGVIALIATPIVLGVIKDSRRNGFSASVNGLKKAIEADYSDDNFSTNIYYTYGGYSGNPNADTKNTTKKLYRVENRDSYTRVGSEISMSGSINGYGIGHVTSDGVIYVAAFTDEFCAYINNEGVLTTLQIGDEITKANCLKKVTDLADW